MPCQVRVGVSVKAGRCLLAPPAGVLALKGRSDCPSFWPSLLSALAPLATTPPFASLTTRSRVCSSRLIFPRAFCAVVKRIESGRVPSLNKRALSTLRYCQVPRTTFVYSNNQLQPKPPRRWSKQSPKQWLLQHSNSRPPPNKPSSSSASPRRLCSLCRMPAQQSTT